MIFSELALPPIHAMWPNRERYRVSTINVTRCYDVRTLKVISHWLKQTTWLRTGHSVGCWLRVALCTPQTASQIRWWQWWGNIVKAHLDVSIGIFQLLLQVVNFKLQGFVYISHFTQQLRQTLHHNAHIGCVHKLDQIEPDVSQSAASPAMNYLLCHVHLSSDRSSMRKICSLVYLPFFPNAVGGVQFS